MIKVAVKYAYSDDIKRNEVELNVETFEDICEDNMSLRSSDKLIKDALVSQYRLKRKLIKDIHVISDAEMNSWIEVNNKLVSFRSHYGL